MTNVPKGRFTFRFAAVGFGLSALWEIVSLQGDVPLFGQMVGGAGAVIYHALYVALFAWLAFGLWTGHRSGYYALFAASAVYTLDRLQLLFVGDVLTMQIRRQLAGNEALLQQAGIDYLVEVLTLTIVTIVICWWGFVGYAYFRRDYFGIDRKPPAN